ncbi:MAG: hypothetical protein H7312_24940 [Tardiphaga sp.]|nr:hypothetical protein [Tardiphaga sp.]
MVQRVISRTPRNDGKRFIFRPTDTFMRALLAAACLIGILVLTLSMAMAQDDGGQARQACEVDYRKLCTGTMPGGGRVRKCLNDHFDALSDPCKQVVSTWPSK